MDFATSKPFGNFNGLVHDQNGTDTHYVVQRDCTPIVEMVKQIRQEQSVYQSPDKVYRLQGMFPVELIDEVMSTHGINLYDGSDDAKKMWKRILNDPDWRAFRVSDGNV